MASKFFDCPTHCVYDKRKPVDFDRMTFCDRCDAKNPDKFIRRIYEKHAQLWFGDSAADFSFERMIEFYRSVKSLKSMPRDEMSVKMAKFLREYDREELRHDLAGGN